MKECLENRVKMSGRKMKARGETESPNPKRHWCNLPKDHLLQRLDNNLRVGVIVKDIFCYIYM